MLRIFSSVVMGIVTMFSSLISHPNPNAVSTNQVTSQPPLVMHQSTSSSSEKLLTQEQLLAMADNRYANGILPLGDNKYVTANPQKGYIYLCRVMQDAGGGGAQKAGTWIHGTNWNLHEKISVQGNVKWPNAIFSNNLSGETRTLSGNDLPSHTTGIFPIQSSDPAFVFDKNPNSIAAQNFTDILPVHPTYSNNPYCMGGEAGIMLTGVALFNGFDAGLRDAAAYEVQDDCNGHPQVSGEYHYHNLSSCITNIDETNIIGYALDGFPITGPRVAQNKYLSTDDLDECHGITSQIMLDGKMTASYHYVMTQDFPYSVSCFRGRPVSLQVIQSKIRIVQQGENQTQSFGSSSQNNEGNFGPKGQRPSPPQEAFTACSGKTSGTPCGFASPNGTITGTCQTPPEQTSMLCVPNNIPPIHQNQSIVLPQ